jgi:hypothetical protein
MVQVSAASVGPAVPAGEGDRDRLRAAKAADLAVRAAETTGVYAATWRSSFFFKPSSSRANSGAQHLELADAGLPSWMDGTYGCVQASDGEKVVEKRMSRVPDSHLPRAGPCIDERRSAQLEPRARFSPL